MAEGRARELADVFSRFGPTFMRWLREGVDEEGLTFARMRLMWAIETQGPQIMSELKDWLGVTARSVTSLVDGLEAEGFVERRPLPEDRRATQIHLTDAGRSALKRAHENHQQRAADLFGTLGAEEQTQLLATMESLLDELQTDGA